MSQLTLILNAAEGRVQILLLRDEERLCALDWAAPSRGTELLTPLLQTVFQRSGTRSEDLSRLACVVGPGSFTGLRLVLSTASALRRCTGALLAGLNYLQVLAAGLAPLLAALPLTTLEDGLRLRVLTHARRGLVHAQDFLIRRNSGGDADQALPCPVGQPRMQAIGTAWAESPLPHLVIGSGLSRNLDALRSSLSSLTGAEVLLLPDVGDQASPQALEALTRSLPDAAWQEKDLEPLYLRPCDAVDNLDAIASRRGENPAEVHAELERLLTRSAH